MGRHQGTWKKSMWSQDNVQIPHRYGWPKVRTESMDLLHWGSVSQVMLLHCLTVINEVIRFIEVLYKMHILHFDTTYGKNSFVLYLIMCIMIIFDKMQQIHHHSRHPLTHFMVAEQIRIMEDVSYAISALQHYLQIKWHNTWKWKLLKMSSGSSLQCRYSNWQQPMLVIVHKQKSFSGLTRKQMIL